MTDARTSSDVDMLAMRVAQLRERLAGCAPRERYEVQRALERSVRHLADYVTTPDPDEAKERHAIALAVKRARWKEQNESSVLAVAIERNRG